MDSPYVDDSLNTAYYLRHRDLLERTLDELVAEAKDDEGIPRERMFAILLRSMDRDQSRAAVVAAVALMRLAALDTAQKAGRS